MSIISAFPAGGGGDVIKAAFRQLGELEYTEYMGDGALRAQGVTCRMSDGTTFVSSPNENYPGLYIKHGLTRTKILDGGYNYGYMCEVPGGALIGGKTGNVNMYYYDSATGGMHAIACGSYINPRPLAMMMDTEGDCWVVIRNTSNTDSTTHSCEMGYVNLSNYTYTKAADWGGGSSENYLKGEFVATTPVGVIALGIYGEDSKRITSYLIRKSDLNVKNLAVSSQYSINNKGKIAQAGTKVFFAFARTSQSNPDAYVADYSAQALVADTNYLLQYLCETTDYVFATGKTDIYRIAKSDGSMTSVSTHVSSLNSNYWSRPIYHKVQKVDGGWLIVPTQDKTSNIIFVDEVTQTASNLLSGTFAGDNNRTRIEKFAGGYLMKSAYSSTNPVYFYDENARTAVSLTGDTKAFYWTPGDRQSYIFISDAYRVYKFDVASKTVIATAILGNSSNTIVALVGTEDGCAVAMTEYGPYAIDPDGNGWSLDYYSYYSMSVSSAYRNKDAIVFDGSRKNSSSGDMLWYIAVIDTKAWRVHDHLGASGLYVDYARNYMERMM